MWCVSVLPSAPSREEVAGVSHRSCWGRNWVIALKEGQTPSREGVGRRLSMGLREFSATAVHVTGQSCT